MLDLFRIFPFRILEEPLFCRCCRAITKHEILAKEAYSSHGVFLPKIPLLCVCEKCKTPFIAFSQEFYFTENGKTNYTKIPGKNRLFPGNWVYIKGSARPLKIKRVSQVGSKRHLVLDAASAEYEVDVVEENPTEHEISPKGYKLLPIQAGETLIGDHIYHVLRNMFGRAVGIVHDGNLDKLVVRLDDGVILFMTLPDSYQSLPSARLYEEVKLKLEKIPFDIWQNIRYKISKGVLFVEGYTESLSKRRILQNAFDSVYSLRGTINQIAISCGRIYSDEELQNQIHEVFENATELFTYYSFNISNGKVVLKLGYYKESAFHYFEKALENLPGILELSIIPECIEEPSKEDLDFLADINKKLANGLKDCKLKLTLAGKQFWLFGQVSTLRQKYLLLGHLARLSFRLMNVKTSLRIIPKKEPL